MASCSIRVRCPPSKPKLPSRNAIVNFQDSFDSMPSMMQLPSDSETGPVQQATGYMLSEVHSRPHTSMAFISSKHAEAGSDELDESSESGGKFDP